MGSNSIREAFAERLNEVCDDLEIPRGHGRQAALGRMFDVTAKAARNWLIGTGFPEMELALRIADKAKVNINWLLQGTGPKRNDEDAGIAVVVTEGISALEEADRRAVIDYMRFKFGESKGWLADERRARYLGALENLSKIKRH